MTTVSLYLTTPGEAHQGVKGMWTGSIRPATERGVAGVLTWETHNSWLRKKMRGAFHGYIQQGFSDQVWFTDQASGRQFRYAKEVWKEYLKQQFLPPKMDELKRAAKVEEWLQAGLSCLDSVLNTAERDELNVVLHKLAGAASKTKKRRPSSEDLSDDEYSEFLAQVEAFGIVDLGIEFPEEGF